MSKRNLVNILQHPERDELVAKISIGITPKDIHEWLEAKYSNVNEKKFIISEATLKKFKDEYLDIYTTIQDDLNKTKTAITASTEDQLQLAISNNPAYQNILVETAGKQLDVRTTIQRLCLAIETRLSQVFDEIQSDPRNINTKIDRLLIDYTEVLGNILEKYYKFTEAPAEQIIQNQTITLNLVDQHISVFHDVIKDVLSNMDLESSMHFMDVFHEKMSKLKAPEKSAAPNIDLQLAEVQTLSETINRKINDA